MVDYYEDDEIFRDVNSFYKRLMERMFKEMEDYDKAVRSGELKGVWEIKPIDKPGVKGYVARGHFHTGDKPMSVPERVLEEQREPLTDVFEEDGDVKVYVELPGVEKSDIQLNVTERTVEVRAKHFFKRVELPTENVDFDKAGACYKNGVLVVTIPKLQKTVENEKKRTIKIE
jgi:HSP20 family molecular chaperone IbpA